MDLSVAIIFKNEIRCIERCLKSLQPLKECVSCEIVTVDTGSTDGSRAVAERYADVVSDFPWVNDFSAARNAALKRCAGRWGLTLDCDEWLDTELSELAAFVRSDGSNRYDGAYVLVRNYSTPDLDRCMDILLPRLLRMGARPHYEGAIHEAPVFDAGSRAVTQLRRTLLHHDGYVMLNDGSAEGKAKRARNASLLRAELKRSPDDLRRLLQYLESGEDAEDYLPTLRHAAALVLERRDGWQRYGAAILRRAVFDAYNGSLAELDKWMDAARAMFPRSYYTRIDVSFIRFVRAAVAENLEAASESGEAFLEARTDFQTDPDAYFETSVSFLQRGDAYWEQYVRLRLAEVYRESGRVAGAMVALKRTDWGALDARHTRYFLELLGALEKDGQAIQPLLLACRDGLGARTDAHAEECRAVFRELTGQTDAADAELARLAAKIKTILAKFPTDDPAVVELKRSEAYQKVARMIEETEHEA